MLQGTAHLIVGLFGTGQLYNTGHKPGLIANFKAGAFLENAIEYLLMQGDFHGDHPAGKIHAHHPAHLHVRAFKRSLAQYGILHTAHAFGLRQQPGIQLLLQPVAFFQHGDP